jgi:hypothetical protein
VRNFTFRLKDEVVRGMTREQYKAASHWVRWCAWKVDKMINWSDLVLYGRSEMLCRDLVEEIKPSKAYVPDMGIPF